MRSATNFAALPVLALLLGTAAHAQTTETLAPAANHPNSTTNVSGTGFAADEAVDLYFDETDEQLAVTGSNGAFPATPIAVPASALPGSHTITAIGRRSGDTAQKTFTVRTNWPKFGEGNHNQGANLYENVLSQGALSGLDVLWNVTTGGGIYNSPVIYNGILYTGSSDGNLYAVNAATGAKVWTASPGGYALGTPTVSGSLVYVGNSSQELFAYSISNGSLQWEVAGASGTTGPGAPAVANGIVYADGQRGLYALNATTGATVWTAELGASDITCSPAVANGLVYWTYGPGLYASDVATGARVWAAAIPGLLNPYGSPMVANGAVYIGGGSGNFYAYSARTGSLLWTADTSTVEGTAVAGNGLIYVGGEAGDVWALSPLTGAPVWAYTAPAGIVGTPTLADGLIYLPAGDSVIALNARNGGLAWSTTTSGAVVDGPAIANGMLYISSLDTNFYAYALGAGGGAKFKPPAIAALRALRRQ